MVMTFMSRRQPNTCCYSINVSRDVKCANQEYLSPTLRGKQKVGVPRRITFVATSQFEHTELAIYPDTFLHVQLSIILWHNYVHCIAPKACNITLNSHVFPPTSFMVSLFRAIF
jgi:hypothetical protein